MKILGMAVLALGISGCGLGGPMYDPKGGAGPAGPPVCETLCCPGTVFNAGNESLTFTTKTAATWKTPQATKTLAWTCSGSAIMLKDGAIESQAKIGLSAERASSYDIEWNGKVWARQDLK